MVILALIGLVAIAVGAWKLLDLSFHIYDGERVVGLLVASPWLLLALTGAAVLGFALGVLAAS